MLISIYVSLSRQPPLGLRRPSITSVAIPARKVDATLTTPHRFTIGAAARLSSTPAWQLRAWERAGLLTPERSASGYRLYSRADIARVLSLRSAQDSGNRLWRYAGVEADPDDVSRAKPHTSGVHRETALLPAPVSDTAAATAAQAGLNWLREIAGATWSVLVAYRDGGLRVVAVSGRLDLELGVFNEQEALIWRALIEAGHAGSAPQLGPVRPGEAVMTPIRAHGTAWAVVAAGTAVATLQPLLPALALLLEQGAIRQENEAELLRREREARIARRLAHGVAHMAEPARVYLEALDCALEATGATVGNISFVDPARQLYVLAAQRGLSDRYVRGIADWKLHEGLAGRSYGLREPLIVADLQSHPGVAREIVRLEGLHAYICVPLLRGTKCYGIIQIMSRGDRRFDQADVNALSVIATMLSLAAESALLAGELLALREERAKVFREWAEQTLAASAAERDRVAHILRAEVARIRPDYVDRTMVDDRLEDLEARLSGLASEIETSERSFVDLIPTVRDQLVPAVSHSSGKDVELTVGEWPATLALSMSSRVYLLLASLLASAARSARSRVALHLAEDRRGLVLEVADDREGPVDLDPIATVPAESEGLLRSIAAILDQGVRSGFSCVLRVVVPVAAPPQARLTDKERQILVQLSSGQTNRELAINFGISPKTLQNHLTAIYRKIGVVNRGQAIRYVLKAHR